MAPIPCAPLSPPDSWWGPDASPEDVTYHVFTPDYAHEDWFHDADAAADYMAELRRAQLSPQMETFA